MRRHLFILVPLLAALAVGGCARDPIHGLICEDTVNDLVALKQLTASYPNHTEMVTTASGGGPDVKLAVHQIGHGRHERTLVLLHGVFTDHSTWRFIQGALAEKHELLVIDLPGCGESDKPRPADENDTVYTPQHVARRLLQSIRATAGDGKLAIVGHSYGGLLAIRMFADEEIRAEYADVLDRVDRMVLFSPADAAINHPDPMFETIVEASGFDVMAGLALGMIQPVLAESTLRSTPETSPALLEEYNKRMAILKNDETRRGLQALVAKAITWRKDETGFRPDWPEMERITSGYSRVKVPTLIVWGTRDETLPVSMGYKLAAQLPQAELLTVPGGMHSIQIERPRYAVEIIETFVHSGHAPGQHADAGAVPSADEPR